MIVNSGGEGGNPGGQERQFRSLTSAAKAAGEEIERVGDKAKEAGEKMDEAGESAEDLGGNINDMGKEVLSVVGLFEIMESLLSKIERAIPTDEIDEYNKLLLTSAINTGKTLEESEQWYRRLISVSDQLKLTRKELLELNIQLQENAFTWMLSESQIKGFARTLRSVFGPTGVAEGAARVLGLMERTPLWSQAFSAQGSRTGRIANVGLAAGLALQGGTEDILLLNQILAVNREGYDRLIDSYRKVEEAGVRTAINTEMLVEYGRNMVVQNKEAQKILYGMSESLRLLQITLGGYMLWTTMGRLLGGLGGIRGAGRAISGITAAGGTALRAIGPAGTLAGVGAAAGITGLIAGGIYLGGRYVAHRWGEGTLTAGQRAQIAAGESDEAEAMEIFRQMRGGGVEMGTAAGGGGMSFPVTGIREVDQGVVAARRRAMSALGVGRGRAGRAAPAGGGTGSPFIDYIRYLDLQKRWDEEHWMPFLERQSEYLENQVRWIEMGGYGLQEQLDYFGKITDERTRNISQQREITARWLETYQELAGEDAKYISDVQQLQRTLENIDLQLKQMHKDWMGLQFDMFVKPREMWSQLYSTWSQGWQTIGGDINNIVELEQDQIDLAWEVAKAYDHRVKNWKEFGDTYEEIFQNIIQRETTLNEILEKRLNLVGVQFEREQKNIGYARQYWEDMKTIVEDLGAPLGMMADIQTRIAKSAYETWQSKQREADAVGQITGYQSTAYWDKVMEANQSYVEMFQQFQHFHRTYADLFREWELGAPGMSYALAPSGGPSFAQQFGSAYYQGRGLWAGQLQRAGGGLGTYQELYGRMGQWMGLDPRLYGLERTGSQLRRGRAMVEGKVKAGQEEVGKLTMEFNPKMLDVALKQATVRGRAQYGTR